jgi:transposase
VNCCGIDLAGVSSDAYVTDEKGQKPWSGPLETKKAAFERLAKKVGRGGLPVAIEAGNQTAWVYEELVKLGAKVTVVNPTKVKWIAESRRKTDKVDVKILCELRAVWVQIAHLVATDKKRATQPLRTWFNRVAKKRGKKTAIEK